MTKLRNQDELLIKAFARLDAIALGGACGIVCGLTIFMATAILLIRGGEGIGTNLSLLSQYFVGYSVTWTGSIVGALYGVVSGFVAGWTVAVFRNLSITVYLHAIRLWAYLATDRFLDRFDS